MYERLRRAGSTAFDPDIAYAAMLYDETARSMLVQTHREYLDIGQKYGVPMVAGTPTWRANHIRVNRSAFAGKPVNRDGVRFMSELRESYGRDAAPILLAATTGPLGDGYKPEEAPDKQTAIRVHRPQIEELANSGIDFFKVQTLPEVGEARGIAELMAQTGMPYVLSFVIRPDGCVLDGTPLEQAIEIIDSEAGTPPACYSVNCVHTSVFSAALTRMREKAPAAADRVSGIDANTSAKSPEELDGLEEIDTEAPDDFGRNLAGLRASFGLRYLGGCCGSSTGHIEALAKQCTR